MLESKQSPEKFLDNVTQTFNKNQIQLSLHTMIVLVC